MTNNQENSSLEAVEIFATKIISRDFSKRLVYHNIKFVKRIVKAVEKIGASEQLSLSEIDNLKIAAWFSHLGFSSNEKIIKHKDPKNLFSTCYSCSLSQAKAYLSESPIEQKDADQIIKILEGALSFEPSDFKLSRILDDAINRDWGGKNGRKNIEKLYEELLLLDTLSISRSGWLEKATEYLNSHKYYSNYAIENYKPVKDRLIMKLEKEKKSFSKTENLAIKQELGISDEELKSLKKNLKSVKGRDERGIQTMFRSTSKNHYTLNQMVDRKANIMISINSIILSLVLSRFIGTDSTMCIHNSPILILLVSAAVSIIFAVLSITPDKTHGSFSEEEVRNKKGNLLFFGNYHKMAFRDYEWGILQMINDSNYLYSSLIKDQYFLGQTISRKHRLIRVSLAAFLIGFIIAVVSFLVVSNMEDFHFGGESH